MYLQNLVADITKILSLSFGSIKRYREEGMKIVFVRRRLFLSIEQLQAAAEGVFLATAFCKYCNIHTVTTAELFTLILNV